VCIFRRSWRAWHNALNLTGAKHSISEARHKTPNLQGEYYNFPPPIFFKLLRTARLRYGEIPKPQTRCRNPFLPLIGRRLQRRSLKFSVLPPWQLRSGRNTYLLEEAVSLLLWLHNYFCMGFPGKSWSFRMEVKLLWIGKKITVPTMPLLLSSSQDWLAAVKKSTSNAWFAERFGAAFEL